MGEMAGLDQVHRKPKSVFHLLPSFYFIKSFDHLFAESCISEGAQVSLHVIFVHTD